MVCYPIGINNQVKKEKKMGSQRTRLLVIFISIIISLLNYFIPASAFGVTVAPSTFTVTLEPTETTSFDLTINTGPAPIPKIDVVFAIDRTGSMGDEIDVVKDTAVDVMNDI